MPQLVFLHGPGAGACADAYHYQTRHFPKSVAPTLPGHLEGRRCADVKGFTEWVRGWLWAQGLNKDLVLVGYTLGGCIALQYALDYPEEEDQQRPELQRELEQRIHLLLARIGRVAFEDTWIHRSVSCSAGRDRREGVEPEPVTVTALPQSPWRNRWPRTAPDRPPARRHR